MMQQHGDDLDDDFVPDDLVALSGEEDEIGNSQLGAGDDIQGLLSAEEDAEDDTSDQRHKAVIVKKRKRREKEKERKAKKRKLAESVDATEPTSIAAQPPHMLADYISSMQAKTYPSMSDIELGDLRIPETSIADTTSWTESRSLDQLVDFITGVLPTLHKRLSQRSKSNGAPTLLFVASAALRVIDVERILKDKRLRGSKGGDVAKLFARHYKIEDHVRYLKRSQVGAAVGTPGRIGKLLSETDALSISALTHIILDATFKDAKKRSILDVPEGRDELFKTVLGNSKVLEAIKLGRVQVVLF
ncbi:hypothetical protein SERLA73DRAFT_185479 [Serpula lacrymans var. lacrymans S7.3]|uniref:Protein cms1 n=2 Tax=Serpula lacrymans var. lacrymans TaxID=341189 RepID=F8Q5W1_SERL3|nr:uncharacterized protein SERLADRAFT_473981 [Serpula lacrymans var. lacrymans S7.9]EGN95999.1 hypothetical protein SERLA73DRAFT_185479 [Serpula lacrymans var. lacrymans S7.3]EGO21522.1 hypothetical protein SERLADRAFT_473981 [Serpula lacrymans var. lacrymans S7.9]